MQAGFCRYSQYGHEVDYVILEPIGVYDKELESLIEDLCINMECGDYDALEYAQPKIDELEKSGKIMVIKLKIVE